jgi:hypothetical protein
LVPGAFREGGQRCERRQIQVDGIWIPPPCLFFYHLHVVGYSSFKPSSGFATPFVALPWIHATAMQRCRRHADTFFFRCCQYAKARNDDEIADESLIDAALNEEEAEMLELLGVGNYLGDLGGSILSGKAPPKPAKETNQAIEVEGHGGDDVAPPPAAKSQGNRKDKSGKGTKRAADEDEYEDEDDDYPVFSRQFFRTGIIRGIFNRKSCRGNLRFLRALL